MGRRAAVRHPRAGEVPRDRGADDGAARRAALRPGAGPAARGARAAAHRGVSVRVWLLGSGSAGNAVLIEAADGRILVDAGFGVRTLATRLRAIGVAPESIEACVITHEHADHMKGGAAAARKWGWTLHATRGTVAHAPELAGTSIRAFDAGTTLAFTTMEVATVRTPRHRVHRHRARERGRARPVPRRRHPGAGVEPRRGDAARRPLSAGGAGADRGGERPPRQPARRRAAAGQHDGRGAARGAGPPQPEVQRAGAGPRDDRARAEADGIPRRGDAGAAGRGDRAVRRGAPRRRR
ncbi:MAG: hypothetical protein B7Z72_15390, partial [Gemmatimonadetes bacterium 21-71-4]